MPLKFTLVCLYQLINAEYDEEYNNWLKKYRPHAHRKRSVNESALRKAIWDATYKSILEHNLRYKAGKETYLQGLNQFSDLVNIIFLIEFSNKFNLFDKLIRHTKNLYSYLQEKSQKEKLPIKNFISLNIVSFQKIPVLLVRILFSLNFFIWQIILRGRDFFLFF